MYQIGEKVIILSAPGLGVWVKGQVIETAVPTCSHRPNMEAYDAHCIVCLLKGLVPLHKVLVAHGGKKYIVSGVPADRMLPGSLFRH